MRVMVICIPALGGGGLIHYVAVSLPYAAQLIDGKKYMDPADVNPPQDQPEPPQHAPRHHSPRKRAFEFKTRRPPRGPTLRSLVKLALRSQSAEEMGKQLKKRFEARQRYRGIDPNQGRQERAEAELERLFEGD